MSNNDKKRDESDAGQSVVATRVDLSENKPDISALVTTSLCNLVLKDGKRVIKEALAWEFRDRHTNEFHHVTVKLESRRLTKDGWRPDEEKSISLEGDEQIGRLETFLNSLSEVRGKKHVGNILVTPVSEGTDLDALRQTMKILTSDARAELLVEFLDVIKSDAEVLRRLTESARNDPAGLQAAATAINIGRFTHVLNELENLIRADAREKEFQELLSRNPWVFGSEYSEQLDRRWWTRDEQQDFMLRRTVDSALEVIEIKTPLGGAPLFRKDPSHDTLVPRSEVTVAISQVMKYLERLDSKRDSIIADDHEDVAKIRARIIIGRDNGSEQLRALRRLNGHLHRIEVLTFDQLLRIGRRVVDVLLASQQEDSTGETVDIPF